MTPGQFYRTVYMVAVKRHGYESKQAVAAYAEWVAMSGDYSAEKDRAELTARPFGDSRSLTDIYPTKRKAVKA